MYVWIFDSQIFWLRRSLIIKIHASIYNAPNVSSKKINIYCFEIKYKDLESYTVFSLVFYSTSVPFWKKWPAKIIFFDSPKYVFFYLLNDNNDELRIHVKYYSYHICFQPRNTFKSVHGSTKSSNALLKFGAAFPIIFKHHLYNFKITLFA